MDIITDNKLYWAKTKENAIIPTKTDENAGYDIYACFEEDNMLIQPHETKLVPTGIACAVSSEYYLQVQERGSTGSKGMKYGAGVIDSSYRGEIFIAISNITEEPICIIKDETPKPNIYPHINCLYYPYNKAIAQLIVHNVPMMDVEEIPYEELQTIPSERGDGALGSSGK